MAGAVGSIASILPCRCLGLKERRGAQRSITRPLVFLVAARVRGVASASAGSTIEESSQVYAYLIYSLFLVFFFLLTSENISCYMLL